MIIKINLIPEQRKLEIKNSRNFFHALRLEIKLFSILIIFVIFLLGVNYILGINLSVNQNIAENGTEGDTKYSYIRKYDMELEKVNAQIKEIDKIRNSQLYWSELFSKLNDNVMPVITIKGIANKGYLILILGHTKSRDDLILFKENLEKEQCFSDVNLPLSNLAAKTDVEFQIDFKIKAECLREKNNGADQEI